MSPLTRASLVAIALSTSLITATIGVEAATPFSVIVVRVYDMAGVSDPLRRAALRTAAAILDQAGIASDWRDCRDRAAGTSPCDGPRGSRDLVVRVVRDESSTTPQRRFALGNAVVRLDTGDGALATIYVDRVDRLARHSAADVGTILGRAIAHEVGHLLLRSNAHGDDGLMREIWTEKELLRNRPEDWLFSPVERAQLQSASGAVARSGLPASEINTETR